MDDHHYYDDHDNDDHPTHLYDDHDNDHVIIIPTLIMMIIIIIPSTHYILSVTRVDDSRRGLIKITRVGLDGNIDDH